MLSIISAILGLIGSLLGFVLSIGGTIIGILLVIWIIKALKKYVTNR